MEHEKSIVIIICYMGKLPWYFDFFLQSCKYNPSVDFIIITDDQSYEGELPSNIKIIYKDIIEINDIASEKLGFKTNISSGYKLCDFKPTYGLLFSELVQAYDFWGHGDLDVIFGNIRTFMTDDILSNFDLIAVRDDFLTGYFQLFRNDDKMRMLFKESKDYQKILSSDIHYCFDETNFKWNEFASNMHYSEILSDVESMTHVVKRLDETKHIKAYFDFHVLEGNYGKISWNKGKLMYKNKYEVLLFHLIIFKQHDYKKTFRLMPESYKISKTRIYR